jgi:hypothetical protein
MSRFDLQVVVKEMKKEKPFLKEVNSQSLQYPVYSLTRAYINYEEGRAAHPVFKKKYARQHSIARNTGVSARVSSSSPSSGRASR